MVSNTSNNTNITIKIQSASGFIEGAQVPSIAANSSSALGHTYAVTLNVLSAAPNGFVLLQLTNPLGSGNSAYILKISIGSATECLVDVSRDAAFAAAGTALTPRNLNFGLSDNSNLTTKVIVGTSDPIIGGSLVFSAIDNGGLVIADYNGIIIIPPNHTLLVRVKNTGGQAKNISINITWTEVVMKYKFFCSVTFYESGIF